MAFIRSSQSSMLDFWSWCRAVQIWEPSMANSMSVKQFVGRKTVESGGNFDCQFSRGIIDWRLKEPQQDGVSLCIDMYTDDHRKQFYTLQLGGEGLQLPSTWTWHSLLCCEITVVVVCNGIFYINGLDCVGSGILKCRWVGLMEWWAGLGWVKKTGPTAMSAHTNWPSVLVIFDDNHSYTVKAERKEKIMLPCTTPHNHVRTVCSQNFTKNNR